MKLYAVVAKGIITKIAMGENMPPNAIEIPNSGQVYVGDTLDHFVNSDPFAGRKPLKVLVAEGLESIPPGLELNEAGELVPLPPPPEKEEEPEEEPEDEQDPEERAEEERKENIRQQARAQIQQVLRQKVERNLDALAERLDLVSRLFLVYEGQIDLAESETKHPPGGKSKGE